jgi:hypothetical protein
MELSTMSGHLLSFGSISHFVNAALIGAMSATIKSAVRFHAMTYNLAATVRARRRHGMNGTLKTIEHVDFTALVNLKALIVLVATHFTNIVRCARP